MRDRFKPWQWRSLLLSGGWTLCRAPTAIGASLPICLIKRGLRGRAAVGAVGAVVCSIVLARLDNDVRLTPVVEGPVVAKVGDSHRLMRIERYQFSEPEARSGEWRSDLPVAVATSDPGVTATGRFPRISLNMKALAASSGGRGGRGGRLQYCSDRPEFPVHLRSTREKKQAASASAFHSSGAFRA